jgi:hypothetical protein
MIQLGPAPRPGCVLRPAASSASPVRLVQRRPARSEDVAVMGIGDKPEQLVARELGADSFSTYHATTSKPLCGEDLEPVAGAGRVLFVGGSPQVGSDIAHGPGQFILNANFLNRPSASAARERIVKPPPCLSARHARAFQGPSDKAQSRRASCSSISVSLCKVAGSRSPAPALRRIDSARRLT